MIRLFTLITLTVFLIIIGINTLGENSGYVYIKIHQTIIEMSLLTLLIIGITIFIGIHYLWKFTNKIFHLKQDLGNWKYQRNLEQSYKNLTKGFVELGSGNYKKAQKLLISSAEKTKYSLVPLMGAANAAQQQGDEKIQNFLLEKALNENKAAALSLQLIKADYFMNLGNYIESQAVLDNLGEKIKNNSLALKIQANIYARTSKWDKFLPLLPKLRKKTNFTKEEIIQLEYQAYRYGLMNANDENSVKAQWRKIPKLVQENKAILVEYIFKLRANQQYDAAGKQLLKALDKSWDEDLAILYAELPIRSFSKQIGFLKQWLSEYKPNAQLYLAMAKLYASKELWVMAADMAEESIKLKDTLEAQNLLNKAKIKISEHEVL